MYVCVVKSGVAEPSVYALNLHFLLINLEPNIRKELTILSYYTRYEENAPEICNALFIVYFIFLFKRSIGGAMCRMNDTPNFSVS